MIISMRTLYQKCKLVHGDLSEYNILYFEVGIYLRILWDNLSVTSADDYNRWSFFQGHLYIIDVSQAVDLDHPHALDFLREDCVHVSVSYL